MKKTIRTCLIICLFEFIAAAVLLNFLPETIPSHWNFAGEVDSMMGKWSIFISPASALFTTFVLGVIPTIEPKKENIIKSEKLLSIIMTAMVLFFAVLMAIVTVSSFDLAFRADMIITILTGILFMAIGNYLPKTKQNFFIGIRTPWALSSEVVWTKTNRAGGWMFMILGLLFVVGTFLPAPVNFILPIAAMFAGIIFVYVYSYVLFRKMPKKS